VIATLPVCVTTRAGAVRELIDRNLAMYGELPSYRAMFDREGVRGPGDVALVGSEAEVRSSIERLAAAGVTDFAASEFASEPDERAATRALLAALAREGR
jgi:alkanesulfonate monooxygenase SsuD/methylene tetrahydromethanopterin reductase-like flavin-dependent oxidoreductase (luciferase family)